MSLRGLRGGLTSIARPSRVVGSAWSAQNVASTRGSSDATPTGAMEVKAPQAPSDPLPVSMASAMATMGQRPALPDASALHDWEGFRTQAKAAVDAICDYHASLRASSNNAADSAVPLPSVAPATSRVPLTQSPFAAALLSDGGGRRPEGFNELLKDYTDHVVPGMVHWQHPKFFGYFPALASPSAMLGEMLASSVNQPGFSWATSPAATELEIIVMDWWATALGLPPGFHWRGGTGGGALQANATESTIVALLAASCRQQKRSEPYWMSQMRQQTSTLGPAMTAASKAHGAVPITSLDARYGPQGGPASTTTAAGSVAAPLKIYYSDQSHFCIEKAARVVGLGVKGVNLRKLKAKFIPDVEVGKPYNAGTGADAMENYTLLPETLEAAMLEDRQQGAIPFFVHLNLGSTGTCSIDDVVKLAAVAKKYGAWVHLDGAYGGAALVCPELRDRLLNPTSVPLVDSPLHNVDSVVVNGSKWLGLMMGTSLFFCQDMTSVRGILSATAPLVSDASRRMVERIAGLGVKDVASAKSAQVATTAAQVPFPPPVDMKELHLGLGRPFAAMKLLAAVRMVGVEGYRSLVRRHVLLARHLEQQLLGSDGIIQLVSRSPLFGLVVFRVKGAPDAVQEKLVQRMLEEGVGFVVTATVQNALAIRIALSHPALTYEDMDALSRKIVELAREVVLD